MCNMVDPILVYGCNYVPSTSAEGSASPAVASDDGHIQDEGAGTATEEAVERQSKVVVEELAPATCNIANAMVSLTRRQR